MPTKQLVIIIVAVAFLSAGLGVVITNGKLREPWNEGQRRLTCGLSPTGPEMKQAW